MNSRKFVAALSEIHLDNVFNPYSDHCPVHDLATGPSVRRNNLRSYLTAVETLGTDTIWMGRDLGYRGGRRTGLALTDEGHLGNLAASYPGTLPARATRGPAVIERTASEIWAALDQIKRPPLLWNVFPFHPHEFDKPFTNRRFKTSELAQVNELNHQLIRWQGIRRIVCIGRDAAEYATGFGVEVECIRHPSYGGIKDFRAGLVRLYGSELHLDYSPQKVFLL